MYIVYKITNKINGKYYIGVHKTMNVNDSYMGSGVAIKNAISKYGLNNFSKDILFETEIKEDAYARERLLTVDYDKNFTYNMKLGGIGGFTKENSRKGHIARSRKAGLRNKELGKGAMGYSKDQLSDCGRKGGLANRGKPKSEEHKQRLRDSWAKKKLNV